MVLGQQWEKNIHAQINLGKIKKQKMTPQAVYILVYKNAIANGLRITQKLPLQNVKQFDDMIKHNDKSMNNNFSHLFTQFISQLAQMHKKTNIAMTEWEQYFNKLQHGLTFYENNPDVIENSENENCNKNYYKTMLVHRKTNHTTNIKYIRWTNVPKIWLKNYRQSQNT